LVDRVDKGPQELGIWVVLPAGWQVIGAITENLYLRNIKGFKWNHK
jgi:transposase InsO family protein